MNDVQFLSVVKHVTTEIGGNQTHPEMFQVRRKNLNEALQWLKEHNPEYKHITIDTDSEWFKQETTTFNGMEILTHDELHTQEDDLHDPDEDIGPAPHSTKECCPETTYKLWDILTIPPESDFLQKT